MLFVGIHTVFAIPTASTCPSVGLSHRTTHGEYSQKTTGISLVQHERGAAQVLMLPNYSVFGALLWRFGCLTENLYHVFMHTSIVVEGSKTMQL